MKEVFTGGTIIDWLLYSPDFNPIENVWNYMKRWFERKYLIRPIGNSLKLAIEKV